MRLDISPGINEVQEEEEVLKENLEANLNNDRCSLFVRLRKKSLKNSTGFENLKNSPGGVCVL